MSLFDTGPGDDAPLADRMRPRTLDEFVGQQAVVGPSGPLRREIEADRLRSCLLWGPPGSGKTTLARIVAAATGAVFLPMSAIEAGVKEVRAAVGQAKDHRALDDRRTILFLDEIHRFNKAQQDALLPAVEDGTLTLIGATTENPSFEVNAALLSRTTVYRLEQLTDENLQAVIQRALEDDERGLGGQGFSLDEAATAHLVRVADGDARSALNTLEAATALLPADRKALTVADVQSATGRRALKYDKSGEEHFNLISAFQKSIRGSDPDAALYWMARMLEAGEDPLYVARRLIRIASEDVGLAAPNALGLAVAARDAYHMLGSPEGDLALAECVVYLAVAPKSNSLETAWLAAVEDAREAGALPVPMHLRNAPTRLMKSMGYSEGYKYAHSFEGGQVSQQHLPDELAGRVYYQPTDRGSEARIAERLASWRQMLAARDEADDGDGAR